MSRLEIQLLGTIQFRLDGQPITGFRAETAQALLAYLAMHAGAPCRRTSLAGLLWSDYGESSALTNLRQALRRLRTAIGDRDATPPFLLATRTTITFDPESDYWLDVDAFSEALDAVRGHAHRSVETCPACAERLAEAVELYRGEFLAGFSLDSAPFEEWMVVERERLHGEMLEALRQLAAHHEAQGAYEEAARYARRALALEPWREEAHWALMRATALSGQRGAALAQYEECRHILAEELGVEPGQETTRLYERIRDGEALPETRSLGENGFPGNLPAQLTPFVGRERELAQIAARLADPGCRLLTLVGPGGSGKTRLALEAAARELASYEHGVFFVPLAPLQSVEAIVPTVAQAIGLSFQTGGDPKEQMLHYLRRKQMLLLLDNYEHLLEGAGLTTDTLRMAPALRIVVTSRAALNVEGEHLLPVSGMECPEQIAGAPTEAAQYGALQLFASAAQRIDRDFQLSLNNVPHVAQICLLVGGMPLAILLAAAWVKALTPAEIATEIGRSYHFLSLGLRDAPERQQSMRAVFDHSWHQLAERERAAMRALSVFRGGWTREAAREVAGASARDLMSLVNSSMLQHGPSGRYEMHELLRQYAEEKLAASAGDAGAHDRHCTYYAAALQEWEQDIKSARQQAALAEMDVEIENAGAAWAWAVERGHVEELDRAAECLSLFYQRRARDQEAEAAFQMAAEGLRARYGLEAADQRENAVPAEDLRILAKMLAWQGISAWRSVRTEVAYALLRQSLDLLGRPELAACDTRQEQAFVLWALGWIGFDTGWQDARQRLEDSLALFQVLGNRWWVMRVLELLCLLAFDSGDYGSAEHWNDDRLAMCRVLGDAREIAWAILSQSFNHSWQGRAERAEQLARDALARYQELDDQWGIAFALSILGLSKKIAGQHAESVSLAERGLAIFDSLGVHVKDHGYLTDVARANLHLGRYERARALAEQALALTQERNQRRETGRPLSVLGPIALAQGAYSQARQWLEQGISVYQAFGMQDKLALAHAVMGYATRASGQLAQARQHLCQALRIGMNLGSFFPIAFALPATALLLTDQGEAEQAVEIYALASRFPYVSNSRWFEDVAGWEMAAAAEALPPEVVIAAQERGQARDLWATVEELAVDLTE